MCISHFWASIGFTLKALCIIKKKNYIELYTYSLGHSHMTMHSNPLFQESEKESIFKVLSVILHLGNVEFGKTEVSRWTLSLSCDCLTICNVLCTWHLFSRMGRVKTVYLPFAPPYFYPLCCWSARGSALHPSFFLPFFMQIKLL